MNVVYHHLKAILSLTINNSWKIRTVDTRDQMAALPELVLQNLGIAGLRQTRKPILTLILRSDCVRPIS